MGEGCTSESRCAAAAARCLGLRSAKHNWGRGGVSGPPSSDRWPPPGAAAAAALSLRTLHAGNLRLGWHCRDGGACRPQVFTVCMCRACTLHAPCVHHVCTAQCFVTSSSPSPCMMRACTMHASRTCRPQDAAQHRGRRAPRDQASFITRLYIQRTGAGEPLARGDHGPVAWPRAARLSDEHLAAGDDRRALPPRLPADLLRPSTTSSK